MADPLSAPEPSSLKTLVVGPRLLPLIGAAFERLDPKDRLALVDDVAILVSQLQGSGLRGVVPSERLLEFACQALIRSERKRVPAGEGGPEVADGEPPEPDAGYELYLRQRSAEQRISIAYVVVELALRVAHDKPHPVGSPERLVAGITEGLSTLPEAYRAQIIELDLARIDRALSLLERWWAPHAVLIEAALTSGQGQALTQVSEQLQRSRFFEVIEQGRALVRFATEARLIASVFAESEPRVAVVRARIDTLRESSSRLREALARARADQAWGVIFQTSAD